MILTARQSGTRVGLVVHSANGLIWQTVNPIGNNLHIILSI